MGSIHPIIRLAKDAIQTYITKGVIPPANKELTEEFLGKGGVFVSIKKHGRLRGCIGTIEPNKNNLAEEIVQNAISASTKDPRFPPITTDELGDLTISVDLLSSLETVTDLCQLDPKKYGILVTSRNKSGILLPDLEGIDTVEEQLRIGRKKGDIKPHDKIKIKRFEVKRYTE